MEKDLMNVVILGLSFMFLFTSFQTGGFIQGPMIDSIRNEFKDYNANTFVSMCIIYLLLSIGNWVAPAFVKYLTPKWSMIISAITYIIFIANFLWPQAWLLYLVSAIVGFGAAIIWNAQGCYLTMCSNDRTMSRNTGIFWTLLQCSLLFGNIFVFAYFSGMTGSNITNQMRIITYIVLSVVGSLGIGCMFLLGEPQSQTNVKSTSVDIRQSLKQSFGLLRTRQMALLCVTFWYTGLELSFFSGVYTTVLGRMTDLDGKKYVGLAGLLIGIGEIIGGSIFGILKRERWGRDPIVIIGYFVHMISFFLIFLNFPPDSTITDQVSQSTYIKPSLAIALLCSLMLGFADACYNTQVISLLGVAYSQNSEPAFALFKFFQSIACAAAFFYTNTFNLYVQLSIMAVFASLGTLTFVMIEWKRKRNPNQNEQITDNSQ